MKDNVGVGGSHSTMEAEEKNIDTSNGTVLLDGSTYKMYTENKDQSGFTDDNSYVTHLIKCASQGRKTNVHTSGSSEAKLAEASELADGIKEMAATSKSCENTAQRGDCKVNKVSFLETAETGDKLTTPAANPEVGRGLEEDGDENLLDLFCGDCGQIVANKEELEKHKLTCVHILTKYIGMNSSPPEARKFIYCRICGMRCTDRLDHRKHFNQYHANYPDLHACKYCNKKQTFTEKKLLQKHYQTEPVCLSCEKRFNKLKTLNLHMQTKKHDKTKLKERSQNTAGRKAPHVPNVIEVMDKSKQPDLPEGFNFMSVRLNPLFRLPDPDTERLVHVPETSYREGYTLRADFAATPYPELPDEDDESYCEDDFYDY